ncbi:MAG: hypothetical protein H6727_14800 [Myxococcales bacterium]|nr:hypothetical protein [Myxococcales bacterium]
MARWLRVLGLLSFFALWCSTACVSGGKKCSSDLDCGLSGHTCQAGECSCAAPRAQCGILCVDTQANNAHCGTCGRVCGTGQQCEGGSCRCQGGLGLCDGACIDTQTSVIHCGVCGQACTEGQVCKQGKCEARDCPTETPNLCGATCVDTKSNPQHCGGCGRSCATGEVCANGACAGGCPDDKPLSCNGSCVNPKENVLHCGQCDKVCPTGASCTEGVCLCPSGQSVCDEVCVDLATNSSHCGGCGKACENMSACVQGQCNDCADGQERSCYDGLAGTDGIGVCKRGKQLCKGGFWQPCTEQVTPSIEIPNDQQDNDCDGRSDEALQVSTLVGTNAFLAEGKASHARFGDVPGLWVESDGSLFLADSTNHRIRKVSATGDLSTFAGNFTGFLDGPLLGALFSLPNEVVRVAGDDSLYVSDTGNNRVRAISADGKVSTVFSASTPKSYFQGSLRVFISNNKLYYTNAMGTNTLVSNSTAYSLLRVDAASGFVTADNRVYRLSILDGKASISAFAGSSIGGYVDATGLSARFLAPRGMALDAQGNLYVADSGNHCVRKITPQGVVSTVVEELFLPTALGIDAQSNLFVMSMGSRLLYKLPLVAGASLTHFAGTGMGWLDEKEPLKARFGQISSLAFDANGEMYVADYGNGLLRKIDKVGNVTTIDRVTTPSSLVFRSGGDLLIASIQRHRFLSLDAQKKLSVLVGNGTAGNVDGGVTVARLTGPSQAVRLGDVVYFTEPLADSGQVRSLDAQNEVKSIVKIPGILGLTGISVAGTSLLVAFSKDHLYSIDLTTNTVTVTLGLMGISISSIAISPQGDLFVAGEKTDNPGVWSISRVDTQNGSVTEWAGGLSNQTYQDGPRQGAGFSEIKFITFDAKGELYVAESNPARIRKIDASDVVSTVAGGDVWDGPLESATFSLLRGAAIGENGEIFLADMSSHRIRRFRPSAKEVDTFAGYGAVGNNNGPGQSATFASPRGIARSPLGVMYIADSANNKIRAISAQGVVSDFAGTGEAGWLDGTLLGARFTALRDIKFGPDGALYVLESTGVRRLDLITKQVTTLCGAATSGFRDGSFADARFNEAAALAFDPQGFLLVADSNNHRIRRIDLDKQVVATLAGDGVKGFLEGDAITARFNSPRGVWADSQGNVFIADNGNRRLRLLNAQGTVTTLVGSGTSGILDGDALDARLVSPEKMFMDDRGVLCFLDDQRVRCLSR